MHHEHPLRRLIAKGRIFHYLELLTDVDKPNLCKRHRLATLEASPGPVFENYGRWDSMTGRRGYWPCREKLCGAQLRNLWVAYGNAHGLKHLVSVYETARLHWT